jgi:hypothetical protein
MIVSNKIHELNNNKDILKFLEFTNFKNSNNKKGIGVTIYNDKSFMLKYYIELKNEAFIEKIASENKIFKRYLKYTDTNLHSSLALGKKIKSNGEIFDYMHFKFNRNLILKSNNIFFKILDFKKAQFGYSLEYNKNKIFKKKYFYFKDNYSLNYILKIFNLSVDINTISHLETYEINRNLKINVIFDIFQEKQINKKFLEANNLLHLEQDIEVFNNFFGKVPLYFGFDKQKNISFYYNFNE